MKTNIPSAQEDGMVPLLAVAAWAHGCAPGLAQSQPRHIQFGIGGGVFPNVRRPQKVG